MLNELIKKYEEEFYDEHWEDETGKNRNIVYYRDTRLGQMFLKDLKQLKNAIHYINTSKLETDGINHKVIVKTAEEIKKEILGE
jgi:DNA-binding PadR family transcriptional regulator